MSSRAQFVSLLCGAALLSFAEAAQAATTYSNTDVWDGNSYVWPWGSGGTATYGQVITSTRFSNVLNSFDFFVNTFGSSIDFIAQVYGWDSVNKSATGNALFSSQKLTINSNSLGDVHIGVGATKLSSNNDYVLLFTVNGIQQAVSNYSQAIFGWVNDNIDYGSGIWNNNTGADANTNTWDGTWGAGSFAFKATFNSLADNTVTGAVAAVPGPVAGAGLPAVLGVLGFALWRRRQQVA